MALNFKEFTRKVRLTDGAWGTQLHKQGLPPGSPSEIWNVSKPDAVESVANSYVQAGSEIILTNTLCANRFLLANHSAEDRVAELAEAGTLISKRAAGKRPGVLVFASIGPTGKIVMMEEVSREAISASFAEAAEAVAFGGADGIVLESFAELEEMVLAIRAVKKAAPELPIVASMTFGSGPDKTVSMMGNKPADLAAAGLREGADAVGANCGLGPDTCVKIAEQLRDACDLPIWVKPNAGLPVLDKAGRTTFPMGPEEFASYVPALIDAGATFVGGCCGTTPEHIAAAKRVLDKR